MAITVSVLNEGSTTTDATNHDTGSVTLTPASGRVFLFISIAAKATTVDTPTASGLSGTWTASSQPAWAASNLRRTSIFRSIDATGTGVLNANYTNTQTGFHWYVVQIDSTDSGGTNGSNSKVQDDNINNTTNVTTTEADFTNAFTDAVNNLTFFVCGTNVNAIPTLKAGYTGTTGQATGSPNTGSRVEWIIGEDQTPNMTHGSGQSGGTAIEIKYLAAGGTLLPKLMAYEG